MNDEAHPWTVYWNGEVIDIYSDREVVEAFNIFGKEHHVSANFETCIVTIELVPK